MGEKPKIVEENVKNTAEVSKIVYVKPKILEEKVKIEDEK